MKLLKLAVLPVALSALLFTVSSCEPDAEQKKVTDYQKAGIVMSPAQEPQGLVVPSSGSGTLNVFYTKETRTLTYFVSWTGLADSVVGMHIHGLAPVGFNAGIVQHIISGVRGSGGLGTNNAQYFAQAVASGPYAFGKSGSISGSFQMDGYVVKELDLLNGFYYLNIHTKANPAGEIRGQIVFQ